MWSPAATVASPPPISNWPEVSGCPDGACLRTAGLGERVIEELDYQLTPLGALTLRRRRYPGVDEDVYEVMLRDEHLMSSLFTASETALGKAGVAACRGGGLEVAVAGLGLGYTARAVLESSAVAALLVVELFEPVIDWHRRGLAPLGPVLTGDARCRLEQADFFERAAGMAGLDSSRPGRTFDAILVDIDHAPDRLLAPGHGGFYELEGLRACARHLKPGGVFGLWSDDAADPGFLSRLESAFAAASAQPVHFTNPINGLEFEQTLYLARAPG